MDLPISDFGIMLVFVRLRQWGDNHGNTRGNTYGGNYGSAYRRACSDDQSGRIGKTGKHAKADNISRRATGRVKATRQCEKTCKTEVKYENG